MSHLRSHSLPVNRLPAQPRKQKGLFRRLAKAIPGRKKKNPGAGSTAAAIDEYGSGSESQDPTGSPQMLTPSTSGDSLDDLLQGESSLPVHTMVHTTRQAHTQPLEVLKEVQTLLQCLQSDNKSSQERVGAKRQFWEGKGYSATYDSPVWALMLQEWKLLHEYHIGQGKEIDNVLTSLEWLPM